jgi:hypothetical protein
MAMAYFEVLSQHIGLEGLTKTTKNLAKDSLLPLPPKESRAVSTVLQHSESTKLVQHNPRYILVLVDPRFNVFLLVATLIFN